MLLRGRWETLRAHGRKTETQQHSEQKSQPENKVGRLWTAATAATAVCEAARGEGRSGSKRGPDLKDLNPGRHRRLQGGRQGGWPCGTGAAADGGEDATEDRPGRAGAPPGPEVGSAASAAALAPAARGDGPPEHR